MKPTDLSKNLTDFLSRYLPGERGASYHTIASYKVSFMLFLQFMKEQKRIDVSRLMLCNFTKDNVVAFLDWIQSTRKCSDASRNVRLAAMHSFCRYLQYQSPEALYEWQRILSIPIKKTLKGIVNHLSVDGLRLLLQQPDPTTKKGLRDLTILSVMYDSAARVSEIASLTPSMIRLEKPSIIKLVGKGNKARIVPLMEGSVAILREYMTSFGLLDQSAAALPLFSNSRKEHLTRAGLHHVFRTYADAARQRSVALIPERLSCHSLRHSRAFHLLQAGVNLVYIRDILGHSSVQTTEIYARVDSQRKREVLERAYQNVVTNETPTWMEDDDLLAWLKNFA